MQDSKKKKTNTWLIIGTIVLIILLIIWLTIADLWGDTDVAAMITAAAGTAHLLLL